MSEKKDGGKTVIRPMPGGGFAQNPQTPPQQPAPQQPAAQPPAPAPPQNTGQKTVIGALPPAGGGQPGGFGGPPQTPQTQTPQGAPGGFGGPPPHNPAGPPMGQPAPPGGGWGVPDPNAGIGEQDPNSWMGAKPQDQGFFPEVHRPEPVQRAPAKKISLDKALSAKVSGHSSEANPITASAASLLILLGRLRSQVVDMHAVPLMQHVTEEIEGFERRVLEAGVDPQDALIAKYCLCGTADDIVQNLPGTDRATWLQYSMVARFFNKRTSGVGFFQEVDKALQNPIQKYYLLELMLVCLQLGFEGQYRGQPGGDVQLQQVKRGIYEALRRVKAREDDDISPRWKGIELAMRKNFGGVPVWVMAILAAAVLTGAYFGMRLFLVDEGNGLATRMTSLHPSEMIKIVRSETIPVATYEPPAEINESTQLDRISAALDGEAVAVKQKGDFIVLDVNNAVLFDSGKADVKDAFKPLAEKIAEALDAEPGPIKIVGHTDNVPMSGRGRFKNNFELSIARANGVSSVLEPLFSDTNRLEVDGRGEDQPTADNSTPEGRALNRRVEIMIQREDTL